MRRTFTIFLALIATALLWVGCWKPQPHNLTQSVLTDLNTAFQFESNDAFRYGRFAEKAKADGYGQAATLFRAASKSDSIHAAKHAKVIGNSPVAVLDSVIPNATTENVMNAINVEKNEYMNLYPVYLNNAIYEGDLPAIATFSGALTGDMEQYKFFSDPSILNIGPTVHSYWVCPNCGDIFDKKQTDPCPICKTDPNKYIEFK